MKGANNNTMKNIESPKAGERTQTFQRGKVNYRKQCGYEETSEMQRQCLLCDGHPGDHKFANIIMPVAEKIFIYTQLRDSLRDMAVKDSVNEAELHRMADKLDGMARFWKMLTPVRVGTTPA